MQEFLRDLLRLQIIGLAILDSLLILYCVRNIWILIGERRLRKQLAKGAALPVDLVQPVEVLAPVPDSVPQSGGAPEAVPLMMTKEESVKLKSLPSLVSTETFKGGSAPSFKTALDPEPSPVAKISKPSFLSLDMNSKTLITVSVLVVPLLTYAIFQYSGAAAGKPAVAALGNGQELVEVGGSAVKDGQVERAPTSFVGTSTVGQVKKTKVKIRGADGVIVEKEVTGPIDIRPPGTGGP